MDELQQARINAKMDKKPDSLYRTYGENNRLKHVDIMDEKINDETIRDILEEREIFRATINSGVERLKTLFKNKNLNIDENENLLDMMNCLFDHNITDPTLSYSVIQKDESGIVVGVKELEPNHKVSNIKFEDMPNDIVLPYYKEDKYGKLYICEEAYRRFKYNRRR